MTDEPLLDRAQSRALDAALIRAGVPGVLLMENAGRGAWEAIVRAHGLPKRAVILVGPGNNGGDALVVARHLRTCAPDAAMRVVCIASPDEMRGDAAVMRDALRAVGVSIELAVDDPAWIAECIEGAELVVEGMFGTGLSRPLTGVARSLARALNGGDPRTVVALDLPSGLDADTGEALGGVENVPRATLTCTFAALKPGLVTGDGVDRCGEVRVVPLGAPIPIERGQIRAWRSSHRAPPTRPPTAHKGRAGHVVILGGSEGKIGAALLAARGAHRAGAGLVTIGSFATAALDARVTETMTLALDDAQLDPRISDALSRATAVVLGPGLGVDGRAERVVTAVLARCAVPLVIDADALTLLASRRAVLAPFVVLTPHPLELARVLGLGGARPAAAVNRDRLGAAREAATKLSSVVVLKGAGTVIAKPDGEAWVLPYADPTLGVAGSGDVLAGAIAARLAERSDPLRGVLEAAHAHGLAGAALRRARGASRGALAGEIADALSRCLEGTP